MNRLTFLKSLAALAIAPAALLRVLAREPRVQVPRTKWMSTDERWRRLRDEEPKDTDNDRAWRWQNPDGTTQEWVTDPVTGKTRVRVYDAKVPGGGE